ncbi:hypothetical protein AN478_11015 [Thiohalorhabdus denitrificans]|nr:hypothetical protein AN478_11015 [Thiohalorhabdus denitrificans]
MGMEGFGAGGPFMLLVWILLIVAVIFLVRGMMSGYPQDRADNRSGRNRAREILEERYAKGEIDQEEYRRKREDLEE